MKKTAIMWAFAAIALASCESKTQKTKEETIQPAQTKENAPDAPSQTQPGNQELIQGKWVSTEDEKSEIEVKGNRWIEVYDGEKMGDHPFHFKNLCSDRLANESPSYISVIGEDTLCYSIEELGEKALTLMYIDNGNLLFYKKKD